MFQDKENVLRQSKTMKKAGITITEDISNKAYIPGIKREKGIEKEKKVRERDRKRERERERIKKNNYKLIKKVDIFFEVPQVSQGVPKRALAPKTSWYSNVFSRDRGHHFYPPLKKRLTVQ